MEIVFLAPAQAEVMEAISYYNMQSEGLGYEFAAEVKRTIERIIQYPEAWFKLSKRTHRCRTNRFPYGVCRSTRLVAFFRVPKTVACLAIVDCRAFCAFVFLASLCAHRYSDRLLGVIYQVRAETLLIVAVMHLSREPRTWKSRLRNKEL
jgi:hypothetical protein